MAPARGDHLARRSPIPTTDARRDDLRFEAPKGLRVGVLGLSTGGDIAKVGTLLTSENRATAWDTRFTVSPDGRTVIWVLPAPIESEGADHSRHFPIV